MAYGELNVVNSGTVSQWELKIYNFSLNEQYYCSPLFEFEGGSWWLELYPNRDDGYMYLNLSTLSRGSPIKVEFTVSVRTANGMKSFERCTRRCFERLESYIDEWINRIEFNNRQSEFLSSGYLTILLTMIKTQYEKKTPSKSSTSHPCDFQIRNNILHDLKQLLLNQENCDVLLKVRGKEFSAHQAILVARSPVFAAIFRSNMKEKETGTVDIEDIDPSCFPEFLSFLYCGKLNKLSAENAHSLFAASDKYQIKDLRMMCLGFMKKNVCVDTFCETLRLAILHSETELINSCNDYFVQNAVDIIETDKWKSFATENPTESIKLFTKYVKSSHEMRVHKQAKRQKKTARNEQHFRLKITCKGMNCSSNVNMKAELS